MIDTRRAFLRVAAPAVALPLLEVPAPLQAKELHLVSQDEIMDAFRFFDGMELRAEDLNARYQLLIEMLFETNPEKLRVKLQQLKDNRKDRSVIVDRHTGKTSLYNPSMYDEQGRLVQPPMEGAPLKPRWRYRLAAWMMGLRA